MNRTGGTKVSPQSVAQGVMDRPATREVVTRFAGESFRWMEHDYPAPIARWNYHPELEVHLIRRSTGSYIIGDQIGAFRPGHVAIVGPDMPHDWMSDVAPDEVIRDRDAVIQFTADWLKHCSELIPELSEVGQLIRDSSRGIVYSGQTALAAAEEIESVGRAFGSDRIAHLFAVLTILTRAPDGDRHYVVDELYSSDVGSEGKAAVDAGIAYVLENLSGHIRMSEAARLAYMSEPSFSKYFKKASGMTFTDLVKRLRVASACRLLDQTDSSVASISQTVGFRNLGNFNRQFLAETGMTPRAYRALDESAAQKARLIDNSPALARVRR